MTDSSASHSRLSAPQAEPMPDRATQPYDGSNLSYAKTFTNPWASAVIRTMEWSTGKIRLLRLIRKFERQGVPSGQAFWRPALDNAHSQA